MRGKVWWWWWWGPGGCLYTVLAFPHWTADKRTDRGRRDARGTEAIKSSGNGFCQRVAFFLSANQAASSRFFLKEYFICE